jgi:hypothetical protein
VVKGGTAGADGTDVEVKTGPVLELVLDAAGKMSAHSGVC